MNELAELRMEEYNRLSEKYKKLEAITVELLEENLKNKDLRPMHITHRIKTADSSIGKLERKPDKYKNLSALTTGSFRTSRNEGGSGSHLPLPPVPCNPPRRSGPIREPRFRHCFRSTILRCFPSSSLPSSSSLRWR